MENKLNKVVMSVIVDTNLGLASNRTAYITIVAALGIADETINTFRSISSIGKNNVIPYATTGEIIMRRNTPTPIFFPIKLLPLNHGKLHPKNKHHNWNRCFSD